MRSAGLFSWLAMLALSNGALILPRQGGGEDLMGNSPVPYIVLTQPDATQEAVQNIKTTLAKDAVSGSLTWIPSARTGLEVLFKANITSQQASALALLTGVAHVVPDSPVLETEPHPAALSSKGLNEASAADSLASFELAPRAAWNLNNIVLQRRALDELKVISQPKGAKLANLPGFGYSREAGRGITIYVIDSGANPTNKEWSGMGGTHRFMYGPESLQVESDFMNHGSCVASKAAGPMYGTAKNANLVMVKLSYKLTLSTMYDAIVEVRNDIEKNRLRGKAIINISFLLSTSLPFAYAVLQTMCLRTLLVGLMANDVVVVTGSGNERARGLEDVNQYPALFGSTTDIIVVGGVNNDGTRAAFSQGTGNQLTVSAPGFVTCASGEGPGSENKFGTSYSCLHEETNALGPTPASPTVAGVIAVWLSQDIYQARLRVPGRVAANVKAMVKEFAYPRIPAGPPVVWNGVDPRSRTCQAAGPGCGATTGPRPAPPSSPRKIPKKPS
ncbi:subtilisin-like protein [Colletotrichum sublineola]|nr:subtilisin-like protein [Colletotrichum sublineola]